MTYVIWILRLRLRMAALHYPWRMFLSEKIHPITLSYRMNIEHLPSGNYYVRLGDWVGRFVKIE
ncbi:MAG: hypothetical protein N2319_07335 [Candidatus Kapabacteria bacterium]|nr:hypothetical protein [Candidatus Kapabacteria bacterium]